MPKVIQTVVRIVFSEFPLPMETAMIIITGYDNREPN